MGNCILRWNTAAYGYIIHMQVALSSLLGLLLFGQVMKDITKMFSEYSIYLPLPSFSDRSNIILAIPFRVV